MQRSTRWLLAAATLAILAGIVVWGLGRIAYLRVRTELVNAGAEVYLGEKRDRFSAFIEARGGYPAQLGPITSVRLPNDAAAAVCVRYASQLTELRSVMIDAGVSAEMVERLLKAMISNRLPIDSFNWVAPKPTARIETLLKTLDPECLALQELAPPALDLRFLQENQSLRTLWLFADRTQSGLPLREYVDIESLSLLKQLTTVDIVGPVASADEQARLGDSLLDTSIEIRKWD